MYVKVFDKSPPPPKGKRGLSRTVLSSVRKHAKWLGLSNWTIYVKWKPVDGEYAMETDAKPEYYTAYVHVDLNELKPQFVDEYVRHELFHVRLWAYTATVEDLAHKKAFEHIRKAEESLVSDLERMPLWDELYAATRKGKNCEK